MKKELVPPEKEHDSRGIQPRPLKEGVTKGVQPRVGNLPSRPAPPPPPPPIKKSDTKRD